MWFKNGLKAQKLLAQGSALGYYDRKTCRPVRAKASKPPAIYKAFALTGRFAIITIIPRAMPWARGFWAFSPFLNHMRKYC